MVSNIVGAGSDFLSLLGKGNSDQKAASIGSGVSNLFGAGGLMGGVFDKVKEAAGDDDAFNNFKRQQDYVNSYNSPKNMRKLWAEAGFNPFFAMGNFDPSAQGVGAYSGSEGAKVGAETGLMRTQKALAGAELAKTEAEVDKTNAETDNIMQQTNESIERTKNYEAQRRNLDAQTDNFIASKNMTEWDLEIKKAWDNVFKQQEFDTREYLKVKAEWEATNEQLKAQAQEYYNNNIQPQEYAKLVADTLKSEAEKRNIDFQTERGRTLLKYEIAQIGAMTSAAQAEANLKNAQTAGQETQNKWIDVHENNKAVAEQIANEIAETEKNRAGYTNSTAHLIFEDVKSAFETGANVVGAVKGLKIAPMTTNSTSTSNATVNSTSNSTVNSTVNSTSRSYNQNTNTSTTNSFNTSHIYPHRVRD